MDEIDIKIMQLLESNGRMSHEEISKILHMSRPAVHQRVAKLEKQGVIKGYRSIIDWKRLGESIKVIIFIKVNCHDFANVVEAILKIELDHVSILECHRMAGEWCIMLKVRTVSTDGITALLDELIKLEAVKETSTNFILSSVYEDGIKETKNE